jgi:hypothetical protein
MLTGGLKGIEYNFIPPSDLYIVVDVKKFDFLIPPAEHLSSRSTFTLSPSPFGGTTR